VIAYELVKSSLSSRERFYIEDSSDGRNGVQSRGLCPAAPIGKTLLGVLKRVGPSQSGKSREVRITRNQQRSVSDR
jgi:hypothetical protein